MARYQRAWRRSPVVAPPHPVRQHPGQRGAEGHAHSHPHVQSTYVEAGRFRFRIEEDTFEVGPGDSFVISSNATHGCECLEPGRLIDTFTPRRDDFL